MLPLKSYTSTFCNAGSAGTSLLRHKQKDTTKNCPAWRSSLWNSKTWLQHFSGLAAVSWSRWGKKNICVELQQIPSRDQTKETGGYT